MTPDRLMASEQFELSFKADNEQDRWEAPDYVLKKGTVYLVQAVFDNQLQIWFWSYTSIN
ncbi:hypothetical protein Lepto7376_3125 [[Leptolyngbya] sp. PCC 7376]|uniref:hypothetical protein n=1 Tax=[Leptolyngbya] sp. PCC 7376 TaxID=111781 RepID=UPI00029ED21F|nr:hypothetical protein [[Leptolyngbya] sp. PCC 7376]AFY39362.1 hypothetical protein Lepto7376_3125 [[Leptolyngbya] sp. PCC 7376]